MFFLIIDFNPYSSPTFPTQFTVYIRRTSHYIFSHFMLELSWSTNQILTVIVLQSSSHELWNIGQIPIQRIL